MPDDSSADLVVAEDPSEENQELSLEPYEITSAPNDFNIATLHDFIRSGVLKIPGFQRHYVWDQRRASQLIESLLLGLPIPQIFLYEADKNSFLVIDGQQRLMSIYYFREGRFPREERKVELRRIFDQNGQIPAEVFADPAYFVPFALKLRPRRSGPNPLNGLTYDALGELKTTFDIRTIRNVIIRQLSPKNDMSSVYEIFSRLNSGGENIERQELRACVYHSDFYRMLSRSNELAGWRRLFGEADPDLHMRDVQHLLRAFALLCLDYSPSMAAFLDRFSEVAKGYGEADVRYLEALLTSFLQACDLLPDRAFFGRGRSFSILVFEAVFRAVCEGARAGHTLVDGKLQYSDLQALMNDSRFIAASQRGTTTTANVEARLQAAREHIHLR